MILFPCSKQLLTINGLGNTRLQVAQPTEFGKIACVHVRMATIELQHQVLVYDEKWNPVTGLDVLFGYPGGDPSAKHYYVPPSPYWANPLSVWIGNKPITINGYVENTCNQPGQTIAPYLIETIDGVPMIRLSSDIIFDAVEGPTVEFNHQGILAVFQIQRTGIPVEPLHR